MNSLMVMYFLDPLDEYFKILYLLLLYLGFLLQIFDLRFEFGLLTFVGCIHHGEMLVTQLCAGIVLKNFEE